MTDAKKWPCKLSDGRIETCWALDEVLQQRGRGTKTQGLEFQSLLNMATFKHSRDIVVLKSGKHGKTGLALNFCPFCRHELVAGSYEAHAEAMAGISKTEDAA